jgi:AraC-like DNA-binding protein
MGAQFSLDHLSARDRFRHFRDVVASLYVPVSVRCGTPEEFRFVREEYAFGDLSVASGFMTRLTIERTPRDVARTESLSQMKIVMPLSGAVGIRQDKREALIKPGQFYFDDPARPYKEHVLEDLQYFALLVPRSDVLARVGSLDTLTGIGIGAESPHGKLALGFMASLSSVWDALDERSAARLSSICLELIVAALRERCNQGRPASENYRYVQFLRAKVFIDNHLYDPSLSLGHVAAELRASDRYVRGILNEHGFSFRRYVVKQRLLGSANDLADTRLAHRSITTIACSWGFMDSAYFSRAFKAAYGMPPREYRVSKLCD